MIKTMEILETIFKIAVEIAIFIILLQLILIFILVLKKTIFKNVHSKLSHLTKQLIIVILLVALGVFSGCMFVRWDGQGYFYGLDCAFCSNTLPYRIKPQSHTEVMRSFYLIDNDEFIIVSPHFNYDWCNYTICDIQSYGYNDTSIIIKYTDSLNVVRYLKSYTRDKNQEENTETIGFMDCSSDNYGRLKDDYNWINVDEKSINKIEYRKFWSKFGFFVAISGLLIQSITNLYNRKRSKKNISLRR